MKANTIEMDPLQGDRPSNETYSILIFLTHDGPRTETCSVLIWF
jgi:hypothetical protein